MDLLQHSSSTNLTTTLPTMNFAYMQSRGEDDLHLPITEIDGVKCHVIISNKKADCCHKTDYVYFEIYMDRVHTSWSNQRATDQEEFAEAIDIIKNMKFDKMMNQLVDGRKITPPTAEFFSCFISPTIKMHDECCVCLEMTRGKINGCGHTICLQCISKLAKPKCPLCRKYVDPDEEDDDDDDSEDEDE